MYHALTQILHHVLTSHFCYTRADRSLVLMGKKNNDRDLLKEKEQTPVLTEDPACGAKHQDLWNIELDISVEDAIEDDFRKARLPISNSVLKEEPFVFQEEDQTINFYGEEAYSSRENEDVTLVDIKKSSHVIAF